MYLHSIGKIVGIANCWYCILNHLCTLAFRSLLKMLGGLVFQSYHKCSSILTDFVLKQYYVRFSLLLGSSSWLEKSATILIIKWFLCTVILVVFVSFTNKLFFVLETVICSEITKELDHILDYKGFIKNYLLYPFLGLG